MHRPEFRIHAIVPAFLIALIAILGCKFTSSSETSNGQAPSEPRTAASPGPSTQGDQPTGEPKDEVIRAAKKFLQLDSFSAEMRGEGTDALSMRLEYQAPDRFRITHNAGAAAGTETILIGDASYMKMKGKWQKLPVNIGGKIPTLRDAFSEEGLKTLTDVKRESDDIVNGTPASVYSYRNKLPNENYPFTSRIWIGKDSGLPMKIVVDYEQGALKQMVINYDTSTPVSIEAPSN
ncbi:MAG: hypothetical protein KF736_00310 [Acidobacteria bacterium]|nr:hypothetical protein [Acidobacteriota bacterium]MCW5947917.1 hypothetical protein [Pyrinomonadaceae bacterium]